MKNYKRGLGLVDREVARELARDEPTINNLNLLRQQRVGCWSARELNPHS